MSESGDDIARDVFVSETTDIARDEDNVSTDEAPTSTTALEEVDQHITLLEPKTPSPLRQHGDAGSVYEAPPSTSLASTRFSFACIVLFTPLVSTRSSFACIVRSLPL